MADVQLGRQRSPDRDQGPNMVRYLRAANVKDGALDLEDVKEMDFTLEEQRTFRLSPGDILVSEGAGSLAAVGASAVWSGEIDGTVCFQNTLLRLRPRSRIDPRFLMWWARHAYGSGLFASIATGANIYHLGAERVRLLPAWIPSAAHQRTIAEYLDAATARVDVLIDAVTSRSSLVLERLEAMTAHIVGDPRWPRVPFKSVVGFREGPGVLSQDIRDEGVPLLRIVNLRDDTIVLEDLRYLDPEMVARRWPHMRVRAGDLVVSASATSGLPVLAPVEAEGAVPWTGLIRMWPAGSNLDRGFLRAFLGSRTFLEQVDRLRTGIGLQHWGPSHLSSVSIPLPPLEVQTAIAQQIAAERRAARDVRAACARQVELLVERRQALITAAVTGQLEIPGVAA